MAFVAALKAEIQRFAVGLALGRRAAYARGFAPTPQVYEAGLARRITERFGDRDGANRQAIAAQAKLAVRIVEMGATVNRRPVNAVPIDQLPADPALVGTTSRVRYTLLISGTNGHGQPVTFQTEIVSNTVLSASEIRARAIEDMATLPTFQRRGSDRIVTDGSQPEPTVTITGAGRRP